MKNKTKHTPGPWGVYTNTSRGCYDVFKETDGLKTPNKIVAFVPYPPIGNNEEANNNARLIAAAPELLDMAKKLHHTYGSNHIGADQCGFCKVIAKAEGRGE